MNPQLVPSLTSWFSRNGLDTDLSILSAADWRSRGEAYLYEAELVITSEGGLCTLLNYTLHSPQYEEFEDLLRSFGYYYELGYHWCLGLYPTGELTECEPYLSYSAKLRDQRWKRKRLPVLKRADGKCEDCGSPGCSLEVHHCYYMPRCHPWQYPLDALRALCPVCHERRAVVESRILGLLAHASCRVLDGIYQGLLKQIDREAPKLVEGMAIVLNDYFVIGMTLGLPAIGCIVVYLYSKFFSGHHACMKDQSRHLTDNWGKAVCRAGFLVLAIGFLPERGLFYLAMGTPFWVLLELGTGGCQDSEVRG